MLLSFELPAIQLIRYGERHRDGNIYGQFCVPLTAEQLNDGVPLRIEWDAEIGRAYPSVAPNGVSFRFELQNVGTLLTYWHARHAQVEWTPRIQYGDDDIDFSTGRPVIANARLIDVALLPAEIAIHRMRVIA